MGQDPGATKYLVKELITGPQGRTYWQQLATTSQTSYRIIGLAPNTKITVDLGMIYRRKLIWGTSQVAQTLPTPLPAPPALPAPTLPAAPPIDHPAAYGTYVPATGTLFGPDGPKYTDVREGGGGDCWLLAVLAEVAAKDQQAIVNMFTPCGIYQEHGDVVQIYAVHYYNADGIQTTVMVDTEFAHLDMLPTYYTYARPVDGVLWPALAEKAYVQASALGYVTTSTVLGGVAAGDDYSAIFGGLSTWAFQAILGQPITHAQQIYFGTPLNTATLDPAQLTTIGSSPQDSRIVPGHVYALIAISNNEYTVYNPWGVLPDGWAPGEEGLYWGQLTCTADFLTQNFRYTWST